LAIAPAKLATQWFGLKEVSNDRGIDCSLSYRFQLSIKPFLSFLQRVIATTIATAAQPLGVAIGFVFPSIFVKVSDADPGEQNVENARHHIFQSQLW